ncbi:right-handed parallel beta-helix repeat-containing protein [Geotalea toluenoxydans]
MYLIFKKVCIYAAVAIGLALSGNLGPATAGDRGNKTDSPDRAVLSPVADLIYKNGIITEDVTWNGNVLVEGGLILAPQATLTMEPGTTVFFRQSPGGDKPVFLIHGRIQALGGADKPVIFTSLYTEPTQGDWQGIVIMSSDKKNVLENCRISGAETGVEALFSRITLKNVGFAACGTGARIQDCMAVIVGGGATDCSIGLELTETEADVRDANYSGNGQAVVAVQSSLYLGGSTFYSNSQEAIKVQGGRIRVIGNSFSVNGSGVTLIQGEGTLSGNRILKNKDYGVTLAKARVKVTANDISHNSKVGLRVEDGKGVAWGNTFVGNGDYDLYNAGADDFKAMGNWWGEGTSATGVRIFDKKNNTSIGRVLYLPVLQTKPQSDL